MFNIYKYIVLFIVMYGNLTADFTGTSIVKAPYALTLEFDSTVFTTINGNDYFRLSKAELSIDGISGIVEAQALVCIK